MREELLQLSFGAMPGRDREQLQDLRWQGPKRVGIFFGRNRDSHSSDRVAIAVVMVKTEAKFRSTCETDGIPQLSDQEMALAKLRPDGPSGASTVLHRDQ